MSLQNPDNVVTEERLAEFYQQILPYMGGMPDVLANKFNRADLYSTDEKLIGRWIDGKPLYQKVILLNNTVEIPYNSWYDIGTKPDNIDILISAYGIVGFGYSSGNSNGCVPLVANAESPNNIRVQVCRNGSPFDVNMILIRYTKTTDSAVEIGSDTDYSTTEKIVGTWIDGKPIWQKSFSITETTIHGANAFELTLLSNVDSMISQNFMFMDEGLPNGKPIPKACWVVQDGYTHEASGYWYASYFYINPTTHKLKLRRDGNSGILHMYGTILYTKVS